MLCSATVILLPHSNTRAPLTAQSGLVLAVSVLAIFERRGSHTALNWNARGAVLASLGLVQATTAANIATLKSSVDACSIQGDQDDREEGEGGEKLHVGALCRKGFQLKGWFFVVAMGSLLLCL